MSAGPVFGVLLALGPAHDHAVPAAAQDGPTVVQSVAVAGIALAAGMAVLRPVAGPPGTRGRILAFVAAVIAALTPYLAVGMDQPLPPVLTGLAVAAPVLPAVLHRSKVASVLGGLTLAILTGWLCATAPRLSMTAGTDRIGVVAYGIQWFAAALWLGAISYLATAPAGERHRATAQLMPWIATTTGVVAASAVITTLLLAPPVGPATVAQAGVVAGGLVVLLTFRRPTRWGIGAVTVAMVAGAGVVAVPLSAAEVPPGVPLLTAVDLSGQSIPVLVAPVRPGWNLVHVGAEGTSVGTDPAQLVPATARPGTRLGWAEVWLPPGHSRLWIGTGGAVASLALNTGRGKESGPDLRGPDGPECASTALGGALAGTGTTLRSCPADRLSTEDVSALQAMVRFIAGRGERTIALAGDSSVRGKLATDTIRAAAERARITVIPPGMRRVPLIVVSGWTAADETVRSVSTGRLAAQGTYLAPWLLTAPLLSPPAAQLIPIRFAPDEPRALRYVAELAARFPGEPATPAGFGEWARDEAGTGPLRLYAASLMYLPGAMHHEGHPDGRWLPQGGIVPVTGPLPDSR